MSDEPRRAYLVQYVVGTQMEGVVYAHTAAEALEAAARDELVESTGETFRVTQPKARRLPSEDR